MNLELYEASLPEPEPPAEHAQDCRCYQCQQEPFFRGISEAIRAHILATEVPEATCQESALKSYRNPSIYAGSRASSAQGKAIGKRVGSRPAPEPTDLFTGTSPGSTGDILTAEQVAARLQVDIGWVYAQTGRRARVRNPDPLPYRKMGRYLRFSWAEVQEWLNRQKPKTRREVLRGETAERLRLVRQRT